MEKELIVWDVTYQVSMTKHFPFFTWNQVQMELVERHDIKWYNTLFHLMPFKKLHKCDLSTGQNHFKRFDTVLLQIEENGDATFPKYVSQEKDTTNNESVEL